MSDRARFLSHNSSFSQPNEIYAFNYDHRKWSPSLACKLAPSLEDEYPFRPQFPLGTLRGRRRRRRRRRRNCGVFRGRPWWRIPANSL